MRDVLLQPPKALKRPKTLVGPSGVEREDPYYWLRDDARTDPEIRAHLEVGLPSDIRVTMSGFMICFRCTC